MDAHTHIGIVILAYVSSLQTSTSYSPRLKRWHVQKAERKWQPSWPCIFSSFPFLIHCLHQGMAVWPEASGSQSPWGVCTHKQNTAHKHTSTRFMQEITPITPCFNQLQGCMGAPSDANRQSFIDTAGGEVAEPWLYGPGRSVIKPPAWPIRHGNKLVECGSNKLPRDQTYFQDNYGQWRYHSTCLTSSVYQFLVNRLL